MRERLFSTSEVAKLLGVTRQAVMGWIEDGNLEEAYRGHGRGRSNMIEESIVFALFVGRALKKQGMALPQVAATMTWLGATGLRRLRSDLAQSREYLILLGTTPCRQLMTVEERENTRRFAQTTVDVATLSASVNVNLVHRIFCEQIQKIVDERSPALSN